MPFRVAAGLAALLLAAPRPAGAQDPGPVADVPYLETPQIVVDEMLRLAQVSANDVVYDLGSGDGRVVITGSGELEIAFRQKFQEISAEARLWGEPASVWEMRPRGDELRFVVVDARAEASLYFTGRVRGDVIEGTVSRDVGAARTSSPWRAVRLATGG